MTFIVQGEILVDGSDAQSEVKKLRAEQDKLKGSAEQVSQSTSRWSRTTEAARARLASLRSSASSWVASLRQVEQGQELAAGSAANLTAQFNDIGVMLAAGQNPLQLAIQQGTQITQAFGNRGAASAIAATRAAFVNMISPLNLVTIGSIAAGAALVQWMTSASEEAESFEDRLDAMTDAVDRFGKAQKDAFQSATEMIAQFGSASPELRAVLQDLAALAKIDAQKNINEIAAALRAMVAEAPNARNSFAGAVQFLGLDFATLQARELGTELSRNLEVLRSSEEPSKRLQAALDVRTILLEASGGLDQLNEQQREFYDGLTQLIQQLEVFGARVRQPWEDLKETGKDLWSSIAANAEEYLSKRLDIQRSTQATIQQLQLEAEINEAIKAHGEGSVQVAELRLQAEREVFAQRVEELEITDALKKEMLASWDAANGVASVDMAGNISLAVGEAQRLAEQLHAARGAAILARVKSNPDFNDPRGESPGAGNSEYVYRDQGLPRVDLPSNPTKPRGKSGASTSAYDRERKAIEELLRREQERLEILRETDPVLQEMIRHRETMASATDKEREALEAIIRKRVEEQNAIEAAQGATELLGDVSGDVLTALTARGDEATDAWRRVKAAIAAAVLEAALLGEGSLAGLFGTSESGGLFGKIFKRAEGGIITGKGGDRADQEIVLASPGEFFVNAKATRKHRHLLEAINAGALLPGMIPSFANGGAFAAPPVAPGGFAASGVSGERGASRVLIEPSPLFRAVVKEQAQDTALEVVQGHDRENSNATFDRNLNDPWSIG